jgi:hypothetical protein
MPKYTTSLRNGRLVSDDGSTEEWYLDDVLHREDGPAVTYIHSFYIESFWFNKGKLHREGGPAYISSKGKMMWYRMGKFHREDGPAVIKENGVKNWALEGIFLKKEEWWERISYEQKLKALFDGEGV